MTITLTTDCPTCAGEKRVGCGHCAGTGEGQSGPPDCSGTCRHCNGHCEVECETCKGTGTIDRNVIAELERWAGGETQISDDDAMELVLCLIDAYERLEAA